MGSAFAGSLIVLVLLIWVTPELARIACALERLAKAAEDERGEHVDAGKGEP